MYRKAAKIRRIEVSNSDAKTGGAVILEHVSIFEVQTSNIITSKDTSLFVAYADASVSVDDMKLVEIVSKNYLSLSTLFCD